MTESKLPASGQRYTSNVIAPLTVLLDLVCLLAAAPLAVLAYAWFVGDKFEPGVHMVAAFIAGGAFLLIRQAQGVYSQPLAQLRNVDTIVVVDYAVAALLSSAIIWQFGLVDKFSRGLTLFYVGICLFILLISRFVHQTMLARLARSGRIGQRAAIYGADGEMVDRTCRLLRLQYLPQLRLVGVVDDRERGDGASELPFLGGLPQLIDLARAGEIDQVFIALPNITRERLAAILEALSEVAVDVSLIPTEAVLLAPDYRINFLGDLPILTLWQRPIRDVDLVMKRVEDIALAAVALVVLAPLFLVTALLIKLTSAGPVLFVQPRFGFNNKEIRVYKFRSMYVDKQDVMGAARTRKDDKRVTPVGRVIRKFSIDELPQLWNVVRGEMSIVGPRPHAVHMKVGDAYYFDAVKGYGARHRVKPGITGLAQVRGLRGEIHTIERAKRRIELDTYYIDNWSIGLDFRILIETVVGFAFDKNAY